MLLERCNHGFPSLPLGPIPKQNWMACVCRHYAVKVIGTPKSGTEKSPGASVSFRNINGKVPVGSVCAKPFSRMILAADPFADSS